MPSRGIRLPAPRPEPPHQMSSITPPPDLNQDFACRSQGALTDQSWFEPFSPHQKAKRPLEVGCSSMLEDDKPADDRMARAEAQLIARPSWSGRNGEATNRGSQSVHPADKGESSRSSVVVELCERIELALPAGDQTGTVWLQTPLPHQQAKRPQPHRHSSTHSGPLTSSGATRPRTAARVAVLRTSDLA